MLLVTKAVIEMIKYFNLDYDIDNNLADDLTIKLEEERQPNISKKDKKINKHIDDIEEIFKNWKSKLSDVNNARLTKRLKNKIATKLNKWNKDKVIKAIDNYNEVYRSKYYYKHNWTLYSFIEQGNGAARFVEGLDQKHDGDLWKDYQQKFGTTKSKKKREKDYSGIDDFMEI
jgi:hypothetical protein